MDYILFDDHTRENLLPLTLTRPVADIRIGILTIREKWQWFFKDDTIQILTVDYLAEKHSAPIVNAKCCYINGSVCPTELLVQEIARLQLGECIVSNGETIAFVTDHAVSIADLQNLTELHVKTIKDFNDELLLKVNYPWDIFRLNGSAIKMDFDILTKGRKSAPISDTNRILRPENVFVEDGVKMEFAILNASDGPIYLGKDSEVMEGSVIRGPFALGEHASVKMSAKIYGPTTIGPHSKVGGEINNSVVFGYSNKAHDGFLGNSVLGEWVNLGADTNNSNLKNNYSIVKVWSMDQKKYVSTGLQFCGLIMGDHSKAGINTMFNTGTVVGVSANVFGSGFPPKYIPSFTWGGAEGTEIYDFDKAIVVAENVYKRRNMELSEPERNILHKVFEMGS